MGLFKLGAVAVQDADDVDYVDDVDDNIEKLKFLIIT